MNAEGRHRRDRRRFGELLRAYRLRAGFRTQGDLAAAAGVSSASEVSRAESGDVSEHLARALVAAIQSRYPLRLDETQDFATAFLFPDAPEHARGQSPAIGLLVAALQHSPFWCYFVGAAEREAAKYGYLLAVAQHHNEIDRQREYLNLLARKRPLAGLLIAPAYGVRKAARDFEREAVDPLLTLSRQGVPIVFVDRAPSVPTPFPCVRPDHAYMARAAVEELHRHGHRRIGAIFGARHSPVCAEQYRGFLAALDEFGAFGAGDDADARGRWLDRWVAFGEEPPQERREADRIRRGHTAGREVATRLLSQGGTPPTALVCGTAALALETLAAARLLADRGVVWPVPGALSLIAVEGAPSLDWAYPSVTSIDCGLDGLAQRAVAKLVALIADPEDERTRRDEVPSRVYEISRRQSIRALSGEPCPGPVIGDS